MGEKENKDRTVSILIDKDLDDMQKEDVIDYVFFRFQRLAETMRS